MKHTMLSDAYQAGTKAANDGLPCDYRLHQTSATIVNKMIADETFDYQCVEDVIDEFKRGFQTSQRIST